MSKPSHLQSTYLALLEACEKTLLEHIKEAINDQINTHGEFAFGYTRQYRNRSNMDTFIMHKNGIGSILCSGDGDGFELEFKMKGYISEYLLDNGFANDCMVIITNIFNTDWYAINSTAEVSKCITQIHLFRTKSGSRNAATPTGVYDMFKHARLMQALSAS
jgi:hypothetical protein